MLLACPNRLAAAALLLVMIGTPGRAYAVPEFPRSIQRHLNLDYEPPCSLCHLKNNTGVGTAGTPFALSMREHGLDAQDFNSLTVALDALATGMVDSDGDGVSDVDELKAGTDPNSEAPVSIKDAVVPQWGCAVAPRARSPVPIVVLLFAGVFVSLRRITGAQRAGRTRSCRAARETTPI